MDKHIAHCDGLLRGVPPVNTRGLDDVGHGQVVQAALALLEEKNCLVTRAVVIAESDASLVPDEGLPELEAAGLADRLGDEHRLRIAEKIEVRVLLEDAVHGLEELGKPDVGENGEPPVTRRLAVLQPSRRSNRPMLFE